MAFCCTLSINLMCSGKIKYVLDFINSSIKPLLMLWIMGGLKPMIEGTRLGYSLDGMPVHCMAHTHMPYWQSRGAS